MKRFEQIDLDTFPILLVLSTHQAREWTLIGSDANGRVKLLEKLQYLDQYCSDISLKGIGIAPLWMEVYLKLLLTGAVVNLNFRAGSTFPVPVCTVSPGQWVNEADSQ